MLFSVRHHPADIRALSIPRDLWVRLPDGTYNRLNAAYAKGGVEWTVQTLHTNLGINVDRYAVVDYSDVRDLVDAVGGIDVNLKRSMGGLSSGRHHLDGKKTLRFVRHRKGSDDMGRQRRVQQIVLPAIAARLKKAQGQWGALRFAVKYSVTSRYKGIFWRLPHLFLSTTRAEHFKGQTVRSTMVWPARSMKRGRATVLCADWQKLQPLLKGFLGRDFVPVDPPVAPECRRKKK